MLDVKKHVATPDWLAMHMIGGIHMSANSLVLEPSAGQGSIVKMLHHSGHRTWVVDNQPANVATLKALSPTRLWRMDFKAWHKKYLNPRLKVDRVVMHPPSAHNDDIAHTLLAYDFLRRDGIIASILSETAFSAKSPESGAFNQWLRDNDADVDTLEPDIFSAQGVKAYRARVVYVRKWTD